MGAKKSESGRKLARIDKFQRSGREVIPKGISAVLASLSIAVLFIIQPFLTLLLVVCIGWLYYPKNYWFSIMLCMLGAAYLGLINTTKLPASDLVRYLEWYESAQDYDIVKYLALFSREPIFYIWMWLISRLTHGNDSIFIFISSGLSYFVFAYSIVLVCRSYKIDARLLSLIIIFFLFQPPLFSISAHLIRQFMAASLVTLFFARRVAKQKSSWWVFIIAIFIHYSAFIFLPLAFLKRIPRLSPLLAFITSCIVLYVAYFVTRIASDILEQVPIFGLIFLRIGAEKIPDVIGLTLNALIYVTMFSVLASVNLVEKSFTSLKGASTQFTENFNIVALALGLIVIASDISINTAEIAMRFNFYIYFLASLVFATYIRNRYWVAKYFIILTIIEMVYFFLAMENGVWQYATLTQILLSPVFQIWGGRPDVSSGLF